METGLNQLTLRTASLDDLSAVTALEAACFPTAEAATEADFRKRLIAYPDRFWLLFEGDTLVSFINGMVINETTIRDELYEDATLHRPDGAYQAIFGVNTHPDYRRQGFAAQVMETVIAQGKAEGRKGCILTCKEPLIHYYEKFGYQNQGVSDSVHGGVVWYDMQLIF